MSRYYKNDNKNKKFEGKELNGEVADTSRENPVVRPYRNAPNIIVKNEDSDNWDRRDQMKVRVTNAKRKYMFGYLVEGEKNGKKIVSSPTKEDEDDYCVVVYIVGHKFESESFPSKTQAESVKDFVSNQEGVEAEIERKR